jgi:hypothetical protein
MPSQHIWTERTEDGRKREVRAAKFGRKWRLQSKAAGELDWTYYEQPLLGDLLSLKEILVRKYQRRRASVEDVASVERLIADQTEVGPARCVDRTRGTASIQGIKLSRADLHLCDDV